MTVSSWLSRAEKLLVENGIGTARLDALILLEDVSGIGRAHLLAEPDMELVPSHAAKLTNLLSCRAQHVPLAYIRGRCEFYGREFLLTPDVLQPRPESETMIELFKDLPIFNSKGGHRSVPAKKTTSKWRVADVGTGSGILGITAALERPDCQIDLLEIDPKAIKVAKSNVEKFTLNISVTKSDLLAGSTKDYDILLCNLPYVPDDFKINAAALHEPRLAIFGGPDGLDLYRSLFTQIQNLAHKPLYILLEALPTSHKALDRIARSSGYDLVKTDDFMQLFIKA